jgi:hypothetical protein
VRAVDYFSRQFFGLGSWSANSPFSNFPRPVGFPKERQLRGRLGSFRRPSLTIAILGQRIFKERSADRTARRSRLARGGAGVGRLPLPYRFPFTMRRPGFKPAFWSTTGRRDGARDDKRTAQVFLGREQTVGRAPSRGRGGGQERAANVIRGGAFARKLTASAFRSPRSPFGLRFDP